MSSVFLPDEDKVINISVEHLEPVEPEKGNRVSSSLETFPFRVIFIAFYYMHCLTCKK